jgi:ABC-type transport system substrate-binding protein
MPSIPRREFLERVLLGTAAVSAAGCPDVPERPRFEGYGHREPVRGGTLMVWEESRVRLLDPHIAFDAVSGVVVEMLFDSLFGYDFSLKLRPVLAAALPEITDEGRSFVVTLKQGTRFHHGRELVAEDVVWSFERMLSKALESPGVSYYGAIVGLDAYREGRSEHVSGIAALDRYRVRFSLTKADQSFVHTLAMRFAAPMPREVVEQRGADFKRNPIGTGAFTLVEWDRGVRLVLARNAIYHQTGLPYLDRVVLEEGLKRDTAFLRFRNGEVDLVQSMTLSDRRLLKTPGFKPYSAVSSRSDVFGLCMNAELAPFDNVHVRRAVAFAIDRERWARARNFDIRPTGQVLPPNIAGYDPNLPNLQRFDLAKAKTEMALAGFSNGIPEPVTMWIGESATSRIYGELAQSDLSKFGMTLKLKPVSFPVYLEETGKPKTAQILTSGWSMDYPDASNFLSLMSSATIAERDSVNRAFYHRPELDTLLDRALVETDVEKRTAMYREANDFVAREAPWAFFANSQAPEAWAPYVKSYRPHPVYTMYLTETWLDLPRKRVASLDGDAGPGQGVKDARREKV